MTTAPHSTPLAFVKGHGTHNDFVLIDDRDNALDLTEDIVRFLASRRGGVGSDGVIRLAPSEALPEGRTGLKDEPAAKWFMDYRNGDGTIAEMCGNGVRVFGAFAESLGLIDFTSATFSIGTRGGVKHVTKELNGWYAVDMGAWQFPGGSDAVVDGFDARVQVGGWLAGRPALTVDLGNPHTVVALAGEDELVQLDLTTQPTVQPVPPTGTNVELVVPLGEFRQDDGTIAGRFRMRVHERGVGETQSCGTGACAAALAVRAWAGAGAPNTWFVDVPGGQVRVRMLESGNVELAGPAELVFAGTIELPAQPVAPTPQ